MMAMMSSVGTVTVRGEEEEGVTFLVITSGLQCARSVRGRQQDGGFPLCCATDVTESADYFTARTQLLGWKQRRFDRCLTFLVTLTWTLGL